MKIATNIFPAFNNNLTSATKSVPSFTSNYQYHVMSGEYEKFEEVEDILYQNESLDFRIESEFESNINSKRLKTVFITADDKYDEFIESLMLQNNIEFKKIKKEDAIKPDNIFSRIVLPSKLDSNKYTLASLDTKNFDKIFQKDGCYVGPNGENGISNRYQTFKEFLLEGKDIEASHVFLSEENGELSIKFIDGRHRYSVMRDMGLNTIKFAISKDQIPLARKYGLLRP